MKFIFMFLVTFSLYAETKHENICPMVEDGICENYVISQLRRWDTDEEHEYNLIRSSCAGNYGNACIATATQYMSHLSKDDLDEMTNIAKACKLTNAQCVQFVFNQMSRTQKDDFEEIKEVTKACQRADMNCINIRCNLREYNCRRPEDALRAARNCYTQCSN